MIIENAKKEDVCVLKQIWKDIFKDDDSYIDLFFEKKMNLKYTFVAREDEEILSTAYLINSPIVKDDSKIIPAFYMCGISTSQQARGKGYARKVIDHSFEFAKNEGAELCYLVPASLSLFDFYKKSGMTPFTYLTKNELQPEKSEIPAFTIDFDGEKMLSIYNKLDYSFKPLRTFNDFLFIHSAYDVYLFENDYIVMEENENSVHVVEQTFSTNDVAKALAYNKKKRLFLSGHGTEDATPYTAVKILNNNIKLPKDGYLNLFL